MGGDENALCRRARWGRDRDEGRELDFWGCELRFDLFLVLLADRADLLLFGFLSLSFGLNLLSGAM